MHHPCGRKTIQIRAQKTGGLRVYYLTIAACREATEYEWSVVEDAFTLSRVDDTMALRPMNTCMIFSVLNFWPLRSMFSTSRPRSVHMLPIFKAGLFYMALFSILTTKKCRGR
jgi:hypothetical protein